LENVAEFIYLGMTVTKKDCMLEEIKTKFRECLLLFGPESCVIHMLPKNVKIKIRKTIILPVILYGCETWPLLLRKENVFLWP
jgi:hypothetical protein